jgi:hypothetical protein
VHENDVAHVMSECILQCRITVLMRGDLCGLGLVLVAWLFNINLLI